MGAFIILLYLLPTVILFSYSCAQLSLVWNYWFKKSAADTLQSAVSGLQFTVYNSEIAINSQQLAPLVTIQLPIYNERYVIERLIEAVIAFDYPKELLEIQVLDDSTDETVELAASKVVFYQLQGFQIQHIRRPNREGFKAGALAYGLTISKGEFVAIFDADFVPTPDFLQKTLPYFTEEHVGVVQTRWGHLNESYSLITQLQAFGLDGHFVVEQGGRNAGGHFINFNGTAGIWRKSCIADAGGWAADTLTEDLDLSYRAQMRGWQFVYLENVVTPAELPATMPALKSQQYRWMKGAAECARKNLVNVFQTKNIKLSTKIHATFHLLNSGVFVVVFLMALVSLPTLLIIHQFPQYAYLLGIFRIFQGSFILLFVFYGTVHYDRKSVVQLVWQLPFFLIVIMGLSLHNSVAALEGYLGKKTPFVRTPKWGIVKDQDGWQRKNYLVKSLNPITVIELFLALYFALGVGLGIYWHSYQMLMLHTMLTLGYGFVVFFSVKHSIG
jgi:cellulose synthase/poly-beta-1,6-N-acetylglucosamine synthase-like glycosyltransferase